MPSSPVNNSSPGPQPVLLDATGTFLNYGDIVKLTVGAWNHVAMAVPTLQRACLFEVHPTSNYYCDVSLRPVDPSVKQLLLAHLPTLQGELDANATDVELVTKMGIGAIGQVHHQAPATAASAHPQRIITADGVDLHSGDIVELTSKAMNDWGLYNNIKAGDEFICTLTGPNHTSGCEMSIEALDLSLASSLKRNLGGPLYCNGKEVNFVRLGALSRQASQFGHQQQPHGFIPAAPSSAPTAAAGTAATMTPLRYGDGQDIMLGDTVALTGSAVSSWGASLGLDRQDRFTVVALRPVAGVVDVQSTDPAKQAKLRATLSGDLDMEPGDMILRNRSAPPVMATHYAPCALPTGDPDTGEKYFDHASLGTDLTGDELMKSIRDFCEGNGYV